MTRILGISITFLLVATVATSALAGPAKYVSEGLACVRPDPADGDTMVLRLRNLLMGEEVLVGIRKIQSEEKYYYVKAPFKIGTFSISDAGACALVSSTPEQGN